MNWEAAGAIGEIIGALAVFITLGYLAIQIRQNTKVAQSNALDSSIQAASEIRSYILNSEEVAEIYRIGSTNPDDLSETQAIRYHIIMTNILWSIWNMHAQSSSAGLSKSVWESQFGALQRILDTPGGKRYWEKFGNEFEESFADEVNRIKTNWN